MNQLTTMGSLEQLINLNKQVGQMTQAQGDLAKTNAYTFLDKDVTIRGGTVQVSGAANPGLTFDTKGEAENVKLHITDREGATLRTLELGAQAAGRHMVDWDGRDKDGDPVPDGTYPFSVTAKSADKEDVPVEMISRGKVSGVRFEKGRTFLKVNGTEVDAREVIELSNRSQRLFGTMQPQPLRENLQPAPVSQERRR
jgi:flagellar basal-body rod modification protein FlgD